MAALNILRLSDLIAAGKLKGQRVFIRADLNVPLDDAGHITEDTRIRASLPAIRQCLEAGAAVMVTSHLGRPTEGEFKPEDSLAPVAARMAELLGRPVRLQADEIHTVLVGSAKPGRPCYVRVVLKDGCSHRSSDFFTRYAGLRGNFETGQKIRIQRGVFRCPVGLPVFFDACIIYFYCHDIFSY